MNVTDSRFTAVLLSLMPVILARLRLFAALAGGAWLAGIELDAMARIGLLLIAVVVIALDAVLTPPQALAATTMRGNYRTEAA